MFHDLLGVPRRLAVCAVVLTLGAGSASAQRQTANSSVGYIDGALPTTQLRQRFDASYRFRRPTRAEFIYARTAPNGPGLPLPETAIDLQEFPSYFEAVVGPCLSAFFEAPVRLINPDINPNSGGVGDLNGGVKYAFIDTDDLVTSFQLRIYAPTGDADRGLGTRHVSIEPALLVWARLGERLTVEGELRYWAPVGGTDFAGDVIRYGVGVSSGSPAADGFWATPVVEVVGWTALGGKSQVGAAVVRGAAGDTVVNVKAGVRAGLIGGADVYAGYGRALTGETWYEDTFRLELRWRF